MAPASHAIRWLLAAIVGLCLIALPLAYDHGQLEESAAHAMKGGKGKGGDKGKGHDDDDDDDEDDDDNRSGEAGGGENADGGNPEDQSTAADPEPADPTPTAPEPVESIGAASSAGPNFTESGTTAGEVVGAGIDEDEWPPSTLLEANPGPDFFDGFRAYVRGDHQRAIANWQPLAERGNVKAQTGLGLVHYDGQRFSEASHWFHRAALGGDPDAAYNLGVMHAFGLGHAPDLERAAFWYQQAAATGDHRAAEALQELSDRTAALQTPGVVLAQLYLLTLGYQPGPIDGLWGPRTRAAILAFEQDRDLPAQGVVTDDLIDEFKHALQSASVR